MVQVKKEDVRRRILAAAENAFAEKGYAGTTMASIAATARVSKSNFYVYYASKLEILWAISDPWLRARFDAIERELNAIPEPGKRLDRLFRFLWRELPAERNGFANNMMQALATSSDSEGYSRELLAMCETRVARLLSACLDPAGMTPPQIRALSNLALMAFDGYAIGRHIDADPAEGERAAAVMTSLLSTLATDRNGR